MNHSLGFTILILIVYVLAVARITRLINYDTVLDWARLFVARRAGSALAAAEEAEAADQWTVAALHRKRQARWNILLEFLGCPWCVGMWAALGGAVVVVSILGWPWLTFLPLGLACSYLVGLAAPLSADEMEIEQG